MHILPRQQSSALYNVLCEYSVALVTTRIEFVSSSKSKIYLFILLAVFLFKSRLLLSHIRNGGGGGSNFHFSSFIDAKLTVKTLHAVGN